MIGRERYAVLYQKPEVLTHRRCQSRHADEGRHPRLYRACDGKSWMAGLRPPWRRAAAESRDFRLLVLLDLGRRPTRSRARSWSPPWLTLQIIARADLISIPPLGRAAVGARELDRPAGPPPARRSQQPKTPHRAAPAQRVHAPPTTM